MDPVDDQGGPARAQPTLGPATPRLEAQRIEVRGIVQGVGFRPKVFGLAQGLGICGLVRNEGTRAAIEACGSPLALQAFADGLSSLQGGGLRVDAIDVQSMPLPQPVPQRFEIAPSLQGQPGLVSLGVAPDLATCPACVAETLDATSRRHRFAFTACAECGPRLSVFQRPPYDRAHTSMAPFVLCPACGLEYADVQDRRFHAQAMSCPACGPTAVLRSIDGQPVSLHVIDAIEATARLIDQGEVVLIKGVGGYQLACDASQPQAVARLRALKRREAKPFAVMARDVAMLRQWCEVDAVAQAALQGPAAPIVLLPLLPLLPLRSPMPPGVSPLAEDVAPGLSHLGAMLPPTALHHLLMQGRRSPIVLTSGNLSDEPQATTLAAAIASLGPGSGQGIVSHVLDHDRAIERRVDDSVGRVVGGAFRLMRRARGFAPAPLPLPPGFDAHTRVLALGGNLKNTFALVRDGQGVVSQHMGDLHDAACHEDQQRALADYLRFYDFEPQVVAFDHHPGYAAAQQVQARWVGQGVRLAPVLHHHAHLAACLGEHGWPLHGGPVLGWMLDGLGLGEHGEWWGGECLLADYAQCRRVGHLKPTPLLGGDQAAREPWRNAYAHIAQGMGWDAFERQHAGSALHTLLAGKPRAVLERMLHNPALAPRASSTGRLFDAVAAALGLCPERVAYEGQAAMRLEAAAAAALQASQHAQQQANAEPQADPAYPFHLDWSDPALACIDPAPLWPALLADVAQGVPMGQMALKFHRGLAQALVGMAVPLAMRHGVGMVALSGGVLQNRVLAELLLAGLAQAGLKGLLPQQVPCNDAGLAWGQALVALARGGQG